MFAQRIPDLPLANRVGIGLADLISLFFSRYTATRPLRFQLCLPRRDKERTTAAYQRRL
jgi:hypothetical protein